MTLSEILSQSRDEVLDEAFAELQAAAATQYERRGEAFTRARLATMFDLVVGAIEDRDLGPLGEHTDDIASKRFASGFDISEVQAAFNSLEMAMWRKVVAKTPLEELAQSIGLLSTVMGYAKDTLSRKYISLASQRHVPTLDMKALFAGTGTEWTAG